MNQEHMSTLTSPSLEVLSNAYYGRIYQRVYHLIEHREDAEDLTQEVFVRALQALPQLQTTRNLYGWLYRIATNLALDVLRRRKLISWQSLDATALPDARATRGDEGMNTLIAVYTSHGLVGRCDAKSNLANRPDGDCICGGGNHDAGVQKAIDNTRELAQHWLREYARKEGLITFTTEIHQGCAQATLWSEERA